MGESTKRDYVFGALMMIFVITSFLSCSKYSSPRKVERLLTPGTWTISSAFIDNVDITSEYSDYQFKFNETGSIEISGDSTVFGRWEAGVEKNPTFLSMTITPFFPFYHLNADWTFTECTKDRMIIELRGGSSVDVVILDKL